MSIAENAQKNDAQRHAAENVAAQMLDSAEWPAAWATNVEGKLADILLSQSDGFATSAAETFMQEKADEYSALPGWERYRHLRRNPLEPQAA